MEWIASVPAVLCDKDCRLPFPTMNRPKLCVRFHNLSLGTWPASFPVPDTATASTDRMKELP
jgi:hypothetical protein